ncbi:hypothetical protein QYE76_049768 [Lolium multiflorum]|uniref:Uncharacterized protein n=1 Tax=Lolium multiflorum TaxID=4521 RepID=A0AAD8SPQ8_LOLMU|nr:hypothetical protein QYE76_049768 [Lolium multiflorum]
MPPPAGVDILRALCAAAVKSFFQLHAHLLAGVRGGMCPRPAPGPLPPSCVTTCALGPLPDAHACTALIRARMVATTRKEFDDMALAGAP